MRLSLITIIAMCAVLMAGAANAGHKPNHGGGGSGGGGTTLDDLACTAGQAAIFDGANWGCEDFIVPELVLRVFDANGDQVGRVMGIDNGSPIVLIEFENDNGEIVDVIFGASEGGLAPVTTDVLYYSDSLCDTEPHFTANGLNLNFENSFGRSVAYETGFGTRDLYYATSLTEVFLDPAYRLQGGVCELHGSTQWGAPGELLEPDLSGLFPAPFILLGE